jgi:small basic protein (TIGR04137 family)
MSLDKSLKPKNLLARRRNVLTRAERIEKLQEDDEWDPKDDSVFGLPKVKVERREAPRGPIKEEEEEEEEGAAEAEGAQPAEEAPEFG